MYRGVDGYVIVGIWTIGMENEGSLMSDRVEERNRRVLETAIALASERGFANLFRGDVAEKAGVATGTVNNAYGDMDGLKSAVMAAAVERGLLNIVAAGLAERHPVARAAPAETKQAALDRLAA